jgi:MFS family permease
MSGPALLLAALTVTGSPGTAATLLAGLTASAAVGGPVLGALLDRSRRPGRLLGIALGGYAGALALLSATLSSVATPVAFAVAVLAGLFGPALTGGWTAQLPMVLAQVSLARGSALDALTFDAASLIGPGLVALVAASGGGVAAMATAIGLVVIALPAAFSLPSRPGGETRSRARLAAGVLAVVRLRRLLRATVTSMLSYAGVGMAVVCYPLLGAQRLGSAAQGTMLMAVLAATAMLANTVLARRQRYSPDPIVAASTLVMAAGFLLAAVADELIWLVLAIAIVGVGEGPQLSALFAVRHRESPDDARGQVFTTCASLKITSFALGSAAAGPLASQSVAGCLITGAGLQVLAAICFVLLSPRLGRGVNASP